MLKRTKASLLAFGLLLGSLSAGSTFASGVTDVSSEDNAEVGVVGGSLTFSTLPGSFDQIQINNEWAQLNTRMVGFATIVDDTASGNGWSFKTSASDFYSEPLNDPSSDGGTYVLKIPSSLVTLEISNLVVKSGQAIDPTYGPIATNISLSNSSQTLIKADPGFGMGSYQFNTNYTLAIPKTLEIVSQTGTGSKFSVGDFVGTREGKYTSTLNFTAGNGL